MTRMQDLREQRQCLAGDVREHRDRVASARERAFQTCGQVPESSPALDAARAALAAFDVQHPEIIASITAERIARAERS